MCCLFVSCFLIVDPLPARQNNPAEEERRIFKNRFESLVVLFFNQKMENKQTHNKCKQHL